MSAEFHAKAFRLFEEKIAAEKKHKEQYGDILPIIHVEAWGKRLIGVGSQIWSVDPKASFEDFLRDYLRATLGSDWWTAEMAKPVIARHPIAQWQAHAEELMRDQAPDGDGRYAIPRDGLLTAYMTLAYDLHTIRQNVEFQARIVERLRQRDGFIGFRYELLVAATFVRAGFSVMTCLPFFGPAET